MKRGQSEIIYLVLAIGIAFTIATGVFFFSQSFQKSMNSQLAEAGLDRTAAQMENGLLKLKDIVDNTNAGNATITMRIPEKIGEQSYVISGLGASKIELRTISELSVLKEYPIKFWDVSIFGSVESSQGFVVLELLNATSVRIK